MGRPGLLLVALIAAVAAPAFTATTYYLVTNDPRVRPLALTREAEAWARGQTGGTEIVVRVYWGSDTPPGLSRQDFSGRLVRAFYAHGEEVRVVIEDTPDRKGVSVAYEMGPNLFGPVPASRAAEGIRAIIDALRMSNAGSAGF